MLRGSCGYESPISKHWCGIPKTWKCVWYFSESPCFIALPTYVSVPWKDLQVQRAVYLKLLPISNPPRFNKDSFFQSLTCRSIYSIISLCYKLREPNLPGTQRNKHFIFLPWTLKVDCVRVKHKNSLSYFKTQFGKALKKEVNIDRSSNYTRDTECVLLIPLDKVQEHLSWIGNCYIS